MIDILLQSYSVVGLVTAIAGLAVGIGRGNGSEGQKN